VLGVRDHVLVVQRRAGLALPGDRSALQQLGEQAGLLLEEVFVIGQVVAEQRERVDARAPAEDDLGAAAGDGVEGGVPLEHPDGIVGAEHRNRRSRCIRVVRAAIAPCTTSAAGIGKSSV
jgi:hypothetical protein